MSFSMELLPKEFARENPKVLEIYDDLMRLKAEAQLRTAETLLCRRKGLSSQELRELYEGRRLD